MTKRHIPEAFDLVVRYAEHQGWIPIGMRTFSVGPWKVFVNGSAQDVDGIAPWHVWVVNGDYIGTLLFNAFGGNVGGWQNTEAEFCEAMRQALAEVRA